MARLLLLLARHDWLRRKTLRTFANNPDLFAKLLSCTPANPPRNAAAPIEVLDQPCEVFRA